MKKIIIIGLIGIIGICIGGTTNAAPIKQTVLLSNQCCDVSNVVRCLQVNFTPVGGSCYCPGQGYGHTC